MAETLIRVEGLRKEYGSSFALDLPSLGVMRGERFGLVGNNGAGKTTFFSLVLDLVCPTAGTVYSKDRKVQGSESWKSYTGSYLDEGFLIDFLKPEEYFQFLADSYGVAKADYDKALEEFAPLFNGEVMGREKLIRDLSKGNQKKVGVAGALLSRPEIVVLDEPFPNLDPSSVHRLKALLKHYKQQYNTTMLISSHNLNHVAEVCERIVVLESGRIVRDLRTEIGTLEELESYFAV